MALKTLAAEKVFAGDRLFGSVIESRVQADHAPYFIRFYFLDSTVEPKEYLPHDLVTIERATYEAGEDFL
jgi:hypothetical protein